MRTLRFRFTDRRVAIILSVGFHVVALLVFFAFWKPAIPEPPGLVVELSGPPAAQTAPASLSAPEKNAGEVPGKQDRSQNMAPADPPRTPDGIMQNPAALPPKTSGETVREADRVMPGEGPSGGGLPGGMAIIPPRLREKPVAVMPPEAARAGLTGAVMLTVEIMEDGRVGKIAVSRSSGASLLDAAARETVAGWRFEPARLPKDLKPVRVLTAVWVIYDKTGS